MVIMIRHPGAPVVLIALAALCGAIAGAVRADSVVLENGRALRGEITEETDQVVRMKVSGGTVSVPRERIARLQRGDETPATADDREQVAFKGGASEQPARYAYLDGTGPGTDEVLVNRFVLLEPAGELAHGTLAEVLEFREIDGLEMARVRVGEVAGWLPAMWLREQGREEPVLRR
jgi:hypothetical protein